MQNRNIIVNALGIQDSGGITVLAKFMKELINTEYKFLVVCNYNKNVLSLVETYTKYENFKFQLIQNKGLLHRLYIENIVFRSIIKKNEINIIYNFSGTAQFFSKVLQLTKVHNLLFYSKRNDNVYFEKRKYLPWLKQIFLKRIVFHSMIKQTKNIEIQSSHVKEYMSDFIDISKKEFFIKSDIETDNDLFHNPNEYDFSRKLRYLYIVGPHFEYLHKNFEDFVKAMNKLKEDGCDFEVVVTLTKEQLHNSRLWDKSLDEKTIFLGYVSKDELKKQFQDNTILISTSVIETLGLHVIEAVQNGILAIIPTEKYSLDVYGDNVLTYELFDCESLVQTIKDINLLNNNEVEDIIHKNQQYLISNENKKYKSIITIFDEILKEKNV